MDGTNNSIIQIIKILVKYIATILWWTIFILLMIIGLLLMYYYISSRLYMTYGEKYEPKFSIYTIVSPSMEPNIKVFDVIIDTKINDIEDVKINDIISFISTADITYGMNITHRVIGYKILDDGSKCLITRGDNNTTEDQSCVKKENIIGITKAVIPGLGKIQFFLAKSFGWILLLVIPSLLIIIKDLFKILFNYDHKNDNVSDKLERQYKELINLKVKKT